MLAAFTFENPLGYLSEWFRSSFFFNWSRLLKPTGLAGKKENLTASSTENHTYICNIRCAMEYVFHTFSTVDYLPAISLHFR